MNQLAVMIGDNFNSPIGQTGGVTLGDLVSIFISGSITVAGIIVIFLFVGGGISIIAGAGNNDPRAAAQGKQAITWSMIGFAVVFGAYWLIQLIETVSGVSILTLPF